MGKTQKAARKMALLSAYVRGERNITKHQLIQYGQIDTSVEAVREKLDELTRIYELKKKNTTI